MEKNNVNTVQIQQTIERLISQFFDDKEIDIESVRSRPLSERLDSMALCVLIINLEDVYGVEFPIEMFGKDDSITTLAEKIYDLWQRKS